MQFCIFAEQGSYSNPPRFADLYQSNILNGEFCNTKSSSFTSKKRWGFYVSILQHFMVAFGDGTPSPESLLRRLEHTHQVVSELLNVNCARVWNQESIWHLLKHEQVGKKTKFLTACFYPVMTCVSGPNGKCAHCHMGRMMMMTSQRRGSACTNTSSFIFHHKEIKTLDMNS